jgi:hypothetical protein
MLVCESGEHSAAQTLSEVELPNESIREGQAESMPTEMIDTHDTSWTSHIVRLLKRLDR